MGLKPELTKSANCISTTAFIWFMESPMAVEIIADSQMGVLRTLLFPNFWVNPSVILNTPPYSAISCHKSISSL